MRCAHRPTPRAAQDKRFAELQATADEVRNKNKIGDYLSLQPLFEKLNKQAERLPPGAPPPRFYFKTLVLLEDSLAAVAANKEAKKRLSPTNAKALNALRQKVKKHCLGFAAQLEAVRAKPESSEPESDEEEEESDEDEDGGDGEGGGGGDGDDAVAAAEAEAADKQAARAEAKKDKFFSLDPKDVSWDQVDKKLVEIIVARGRKGTDRKESVEQLVFLTRAARGPAQYVAACMQAVSAMFDSAPPPQPPFVPHTPPPLSTPSAPTSPHLSPHNVPQSTRAWRVT